ncbi:MAG: hypothetical protein H7Z11_15680 [Verrucomicrobia bacterium]|nr:hypothetical protein [Leptolyngbya sp. ES-bin-22]
MPLDNPASQTFNNIAVTGGAINGTPIGATTPNTIKGTKLDLALVTGNTLNAVSSDNGATTLIGQFLTLNLSAGTGITYEGLQAIGSNTNVSLKFTAKGTGQLIFASNALFNTNVTLGGVFALGNSINGASGQTTLVVNYTNSSNLQILDGAGNTIGYFQGSTKSFGVNTVSPSAFAHIVSKTASIPGLRIDGAASQSANLFEARNSTPTLLTSIDPAGKITAPSLQIASTGTPLLKLLSAIATLDFPSIAAQSSSDLTITVTGSAVNDVVNVGLPATPASGIDFNAFVSAANTVTVRAHNYTALSIDPASASYRVSVMGF